MKMSDLNGSGEMSLGNLKVEIAESNIATLFAQDIVNEVLQKALSIVAQVHDSKLTWDTYGEDKAYDNLIGEYVKKGTDVAHPLKMETEKVESNAEALSCKDLPGGGGVGDQPITPRQNTELEVSDQPAPQECAITTPVEKKSRVADLVKSSKQVLSAYILDEKTKQIRDALEEGQEQLVQVIEFDCGEAQKSHFKAYTNIQPEAVPLPNEEVDEDDFQQIAAVSHSMDTIDLNQVKAEINESGTERRAMKPLDVIPEIVRDDGPSEATQSVADDSEKGKKRKWNLGARIMQFLRRPRQKARGTQTVTKK